MFDYICLTKLFLILQGDSGSGLVNSKAEIVGIVSRGEPCDANYPVVVVSVYRNLKEIYIMMYEL